MNVQNLIRPSEYQRRHSTLFHTLTALRAHLNRRRTNGLVESGAVVESPLGLLINESKFGEWLHGRSAQDEAV